MIAVVVAVIVASALGASKSGASGWIIAIAAGLVVGLLARYLGNLRRGP